MLFASARVIDSGTSVKVALRAKTSATVKEKTFAMERKNGNSVR